MHFVFRVAVATFAVWISVGVLEGLEFDGTFWNLILIGLILGVINGAVKPIVTVLSIPFIVLTLGLFLLVVNWLMVAITLWLAAPDRLDLGLTSTGFWTTFSGAVIISIVSWATSVALGMND